MSQHSAKRHAPHLDGSCRLRFRSRGEETIIGVTAECATIGRAPDSDLVLPDESVSRRHAVIERSESGWRIRDLGSRNGVRVNTYRVGQKALRDGDLVDLGTVRIQVEISSGQADSRAGVVFRPEKERGLRTGVIDMGELENLLGASSEPPAAQLDLAKTRNPFADTDRSGAARPMGAAASARESAMLLRLVSKAAEVLISCDSLDEALDRILELAFENLPAERGVICLYDEDKDAIEPHATRTRDGVAEEPIHISSNIANDVIKRKQSLLVQDTQHDARFGRADSVVELEIHSAMCAPLYHQGHVGGFIYVDTQNAQEPFSTSHLQALSTLAILSGAAVEQCSLRDGIRKEREIRARLSRYSSPAVVERIISRVASSDTGMAAEEGEVTVLFADLSGFTEMAESLHATEVAQVLNQVFERFTEVVFEHEGTLDKFRGDGMMAFFGAPLPFPDHAERAILAALEMHEQLEELNALSLERKLSIRIGINSGLVVVGDVGSPQRKDYTVIGDVVNTASRLESAVAQPGQVVVGPGTWDRARDRFRFQPLDGAHLKGKSQIVQPYLVLGPIER